ncbi:pygopus homolog 2, partial [Geospiza fortis]|uniref:Pygopus homolog 2 n=5 Tax=Passeriformes TaxID=9126 RepID=A0A8N5F4A1_GEOFO
PPGLVYPCGACRNEVNDDQDAILCEASCQKWFHRECTGMTENAYGLLTTEASAVWACDFCLKTKEIQSVYIREGMGQLVTANDG